MLFDFLQGPQVDSLLVPSALRRSVYSVYLVYFWGFCPFQIFIVPIHRAITKNNSESICGKSSLSSVDFGESCLTVHRTASLCRYAKELTFQNDK